MTICPCGSNNEYIQCCGKYISQQSAAPTPEALMRSRYTAYTLGDIDYIERTMREPAAKDFNKQDVIAWNKQATWIKLEVVSASQDNDRGTVEFIAYYHVRNLENTIHEKSEFRRIDGQWFYVDGEVPKQHTLKNSQQKLGRNDICSCGSLKKFKKCCGK